tara:strand:+ start:2548 stop:3501 length:954 start_codon:yes stop_codon:yes gene_type:complete
MRQWKIINDKLVDCGIETPRLGGLKSNTRSPFKELSKQTQFTFPFSTTSHSLGDWGILSRLPECIEQIYPNAEFHIPSSTLIKQIFASLFNNGNWASFTEEPWLTNEIILKNNPHIAGRYRPNQLEGECYTDHFRIYSSDIDKNEPLIEQLLRAFGASEDEIKELDTSPKLYISQEEEEWYQSFIKKYFGHEYGCLLLSSSIKELNKKWEFDHHLFPHTLKYRDYPVFYYSSFELHNTEWLKLFKNYISFSDLKLTIREQMIVKQKAIFNIGYQAGITDAISGGGSDVTTLCPYKEPTHNTIRGVKYVFRDGSIRIF